MGKISSRSSRGHSEIRNAGTIAKMERVMIIASTLESVLFVVAIKLEFY